MAYIKTFVIFFLIGCAISGIFLYFTLSPPGAQRQHKTAGIVREVRLGKSLTQDIFVSSQLQPKDIEQLKSEGVKSLIDLRPDGEDAAQASSQEMAKAADGQKLHFFYIPVPHGDIPSEAATNLRNALANAEYPVLLYCRSGRRAARTWALAEAERPEGLNEQQIKARVQSLGFETEDLTQALQTRIAQRKAQ